MNKYIIIKNKLLFLSSIVISYIQKINRFYAYIAFIHWYISFFTDKFIFRHENISDGRLLAYKGMFLIILFIVWQLTAYAVKEYKHNQNIRDFIKYSLIYFTVMMVFLLLTWPGVWRSDEFGMFDNYRDMSVDSWHGCAISYFSIFSMMIFPFPSGVAIVQNIIISMIVGYIILEFRKYFKNSRLAYLMYVPFLLFPTIDSNLFLVTSTLYGYLWLLAAVKLFLTGYDSRITMRAVTALIITAVLITFFRKEGILFLFLLLPLIFYCYKTTLKQKVIIVIAVFFIIISAIVLRNTGVEKDKYETAAICMGLKDMSHLVVHKINTEEIFLNSAHLFDFETGNLKKDIYVMMFDKIIDAHAFYDGKEIEYRDFSKEEYSDFRKKYLLFIIHNYQFFLQGKYLLLKKSTLPSFTDIIFDDVFCQYRLGSAKDLINFKPFQPISKEIRRKVLHFMEIEHSGYFVKMQYSKLALIFIMISFVLGSAVFKQRVLFCIWFIIFLQTVAVFFVLPGHFFMYYFYLYLCCYVFTSLFAVKIIDNLIHKQKLSGLPNRKI